MDEDVFDPGKKNSVKINNFKNVIKFMQICFVTKSQCIPFLYMVIYVLYEILYTLNSPQGFEILVFFCKFGLALQTKGANLKYVILVFYFGFFTLFTFM